MSDIFREVEEDVRRERLEKLWKAYGNYAIAGLVLLFAGIGAWRDRREDGHLDDRVGEGKLRWREGVLRPLLSEGERRGHHEDGLAVLDRSRQRQMPDVPAMTEVYPGYTVLPSWFGLLGPAGLPKPMAVRVQTELRNALADIAVANGVICVGSSANVSLTGTKFRLEDIEPELRAIADVEIDYGLCAYHNPQGLSSTMIDFSTMRVQRAGVCYERIAAILRDEFGVALKRPV